jgi:hypothetical protein
MKYYKNSLETGSIQLAASIVEESKNKYEK